MREIKFRAWDERKKQWLSPKDISIDGDGKVWLCLELLGWVACPEHITISEFTGLHDKNGKEIWEGDLVGCLAIDSAGGIYGEKKNWVGEVIFKFGGWITTFGNFHNQNPGNDFYRVADRFEVLGNIYENPELLK